MKPAAGSVLWTGFYKIGLVCSHHCWLRQPTTRTAEHTALIQGSPVGIAGHHLRSDLWEHISPGSCFSSQSPAALGLYISLFIENPFGWDTWYLNVLLLLVLVGEVHYLEWIQMFKSFTLGYPNEKTKHLSCLVPLRSTEWRARPPNARSLLASMCFLVALASPHLQTCDLRAAAFQTQQISKQSILFNGQIRPRVFSCAAHLTWPFPFPVWLKRKDGHWIMCAV